MKLKLTLITLIAGMTALTSCTDAQAGTFTPLAEVQETVPLGFNLGGEILTMYGWGDQDDFAGGGSFSFLVEDFVGLRGDYFYFDATTTHLGAVNVYISYPLLDKLFLEPYVGAGAWHQNTTDWIVQGGGDLVYRITEGWSARVGGRYIYMNGRENIPGAIIGLGYTW